MDKGKPASGRTNDHVARVAASRVLSDWIERQKKVAKKTGEPDDRTPQK